MRKAESRRAAVTMTGARLSWPAGQAAHQLEAVRVGQRVGDDVERGRARLVDARQQRRAVGEDLDLVAGARELRLEERAVVGIGIDDQHALAAARAQHLGRRAQVVRRRRRHVVERHGAVADPDRARRRGDAGARRSSPLGAGQPTASSVTRSPPRICGPRNSAA